MNYRNYDCNIRYSCKVCGEIRTNPDKPCKCPEIPLIRTSPQQSKHHSMSVECPSKPQKRKLGSVPRKHLIQKPSESDTEFKNRVMIYLRALGKYMDTGRI